MIKDLCGTGTYRNLVVLTTLWDTVSQHQGEVREEQLKSNFLQPLVQEGAKFMRYNRTLDSAQKALNHIVTLVPTTVWMEGIEESAAGPGHPGEANIIAKYKEEIAVLQAEMEAAQRSNVKLERDLAVEKAEIDQKVAKWHEKKVILVRGLETEMKARQNLKKAVEKDKKWRNKLEQDKIDWMRGQDGRSQSKEGSGNQFYSWFRAVR